MFVLATPESAVNLQQGNVTESIVAVERYFERIVIDECHLLLTDGARFRPAFRFLARLFLSLSLSLSLSRSLAWYSTHQCSQYSSRSLMS
jgi:superfamily II DNA helicase RecQ